MPGISGYGLEIAVGTIAIMIAIGGIAAGLGFALNSNKLKEFGKDELFQSIVNGMLVGSFLVLFMPNGIMTNIVNGLASNGTSSLSCPSFASQNYAICFAYNYLTGSGYTLNGVYHQSVLSQTTSLIIGFLGLNTALGIIAGLNLNIAIASISFSSVLNPIISEIQYFIKALTTISISAIVQSSLLTFIASSAVTVLLPVGLILRTFYPTRKTGGFLIAVAIGMYIILPMSYVLDANMINNYSNNISNSTIVTLTSAAYGAQGQMLSSSITTAKISFISTVAGYVNSIANGFSSIATMVINAISYFLIAAFILPAFSMVLTIISIKEISAILGSEISFGLFDMV